MLRLSLQRVRRLSGEKKLGWCRRVCPDRRPATLSSVLQFTLGGRGRPRVYLHRLNMLQVKHVEKELLSLEKSLDERAAVSHVCALKSEAEK